MITFDCPWCDEPAMAETAQTRQLACEACGIHADLAPDPIADPITRAA